MCSIEGTTDDHIAIEYYCNLNKFRGPDSTNTYIGREIQLGHNLLKISPNQEDIPQPFVTDKGNVLCYNGEIYGLDELTFDTEWLAKKIEQEGIESLGAGVNGMWAFAWYDIEKKELTLCRDHFGQKPLYYMIERVKDKDQLYFSSTVIPLASTLANLDVPIDFHDKGVATLRRNNGFNIGDETVYKNIKRVMPGEIIKITLNNKFTIKKDNLWNHDNNFNLFPNYMWNVEEFEHITKKAIREVCSAPEIKKTVSLSGGLDSSLIASVGRDTGLSACSVSWENLNIGKKDPERHLLTQLELAKETCRMTKTDLSVTQINHKQRVDPDLLKEIQKSMGYLPSWDHQRLMPRFINISQAASKHNKIYITGDCADEILTGYNGDYNNWCDPKNHDKHFNPEIVDFYLTKEVAKDLNHNNQYSHLMSVDLINNGLFVKLLGHCDGFCTVIDSMCGYYGMESRTPFLHQEFVKYAMRIPGQEKLRVPYLKNKRKEGYKTMRDHQYFMLGHYKGLFRDNFDGHYIDNVRNFDRKVGLSNPWNSRDHEKNDAIIKELISENMESLKTFLKRIHTENNYDASQEHVEQRAYLRTLGVDFKDVVKYNEFLHSITDGDLDD